MTHPLLSKLLALGLGFGTAVGSAGLAVTESGPSATEPSVAVAAAPEASAETTGEPSPDELSPALVATLHREARRAVGESIRAARGALLETAREEGWTGRARGEALRELAAARRTAARELNAPTRGQVAAEARERRGRGAEVSAEARERRGRGAEVSAEARERRGRGEARAEGATEGTERGRANGNASVARGGGPRG